ncbi:unnamed protein product [Arabidopsis halleri]
MSGLRYINIQYCIYLYLLTCYNKRNWPSNFPQISK